MIREHARHHLPAFLVQVLATAVGLMLALGLDQWKEQRRQAALARAHLASIQAELRSDAAEIAEELASFKPLDGALAGIERALRQGQRPSPDTHLGLSVATLRQSAWDMAVAGQTPLRSDLERMARLAGAYEGIRLLRAMNDQLFREMGFVSELGALIQEGRVPQEKERLALADRIRALRAHLALIQDAASSPQRDIAKALQP